MDPPPCFCADRNRTGECWFRRFFAFHAADAQKPPLLSQWGFCPLEAPTGIGPVNVGFADFLLS
ncbi:hypothetical protein, partial [Anaerotruncus massiliensis (ex Liu et al. 2021)]|uniref:hypothetical protein n=1 Tax=Anaerotruncus massiliensis (ex Liu et al. 2021) TaxID=2321404 RepID=UPI003AB56BE0